MLVYHLLPQSRYTKHHFLSPTMTHCTHADNPAGAVMCSHCGAAITKHCPQCQERLPLRAQYCLSCGLPLAHSNVGPLSPASAPSEASGERRPATILFSDLTGYTAMNERLDPEEVEAIMRRIKEQAVEIVERHGGIVNQFVGDEILALYGITQAHEDDPLRAVQSAVELHAIVRELSPEVETRIGQPLRMHTGIHTGLIVTNLRDTRDGLYGITGGTVITGVRLKTEAKPDDILISSDMQKLIAPYYDTEALPAITLKGQARPSVPYRVLKKSQIQSRFEAAALRGFSRYIGRQDELEILQGCLERIKLGQGALVTVIGDAGIGKSRLLHEFTTDLGTTRITVLQGKCQTFAQSTPYYPFLEALRRELSLSEDTPLDDRAHTVRTNILNIDPELAPYVPYYLHLLSIHTDPMITHMQGEELRHAMVDALTKVFMRLAARGPTLLILEDWHWRDEPSGQVLRHLAGLLPDHALLIVITSRPDHTVSWATSNHHVPMVLSPLDVQDSEWIMQSVFKSDMLPAGLRDLIFERTVGNPLFIEEICHGLIEDGAVVVQARVASLTRPLNNLVLPETVQSIIRSRLDRLDWKLKEVLRLASVIGRVFTVNLLEKVYQGQTSGNLRESLEALTRFDMVLPVEGHPGSEYMFKHVLTQQVAYSTVLLQQRKVLHGLVGNAIEELYRHRLQELVNLLHHHFSLAEDWKKAIQYARESAEKAKRVSQFEEALRLIEQMKIAISQLPPDRTKQGTLVETLLEEERLCDTLGWRTQQEAVMTQVFSILRVYDDPASLAAAYLRQGDLYTQLGRLQDADEALTKSLSMRQALGDRAGESNALRSLSFLQWHQGRLQDAVASNEAALAIDRERGDLRAMSHDLTNLAPVLQQLGDFTGALERLQLALELEASQQDAFNRMTILFNIANAHNKAGAFDQALAYYGDSLAVCLDHRLRINQTLVLSCMASIYWKQHRPDDCLRLCEEVLGICREMKYGRGLSNGLTALGNFLLLLNRPHDALPYFLESTSVLAELGDACNEAMSWSIAATIYQQTSRHQDAFEAWKKARLLRTRMDDHYGEVQAVHEMGRLARDHFGEPVQALQYFQEGLDLAVRLKDLRKQGDLLNAMGITEWNRGAYEPALAHYDAALARYREAGDLAETALMLNSLGVTLRKLCRFDEALDRFQQGVSAAQQANHLLFHAYALAGIGDVYHDRGEYTQAIRYYQRSRRIRCEVGDRLGEGWMLHHLALAGLADGQQDQARDWAEQASCIAETRHDSEFTHACVCLRARFST